MTDTEPYIKLEACDDQVIAIGFDEDGDTRMVDIIFLEGITPEKIIDFVKTLYMEAMEIR